MMEKATLPPHLPIISFDSCHNPKEVSHLLDIVGRALVRQILPADSWVLVSHRAMVWTGLATFLNHRGFKVAADFTGINSEKELEDLCATATAMGVDGLCLPEPGTALIKQIDKACAERRKECGADVAPLIIGRIYSHLRSVACANAIWHGGAYAETGADLEEIRRIRKNCPNLPLLVNLSIIGRDLDEISVRVMQPREARPGYIALSGLEQHPTPLAVIDTVVEQLRDRTMTPAPVQQRVSWLHQLLRRAAPTS